MPPIQTHLRALLRRVHSEDGVVLVEFAIVLPVLVLLILGILYFGRYENYSNQLTQMAEQGARAAAVDSWSGSTSSPATTLQSYIKSQALGELAGNGSTDVTAPGAQAWVYLPTGSSWAIGQPIRVCVTATVTYPSPIGTPTSTLSGVATMRIESASGTNPTTTNSGTLPSQCPTS